MPRLVRETSAASSRARAARIWDVETGACLQEFEGHTETVRSVEWSADEKRVVSAAHDRTVRIWDVESGRCEQVLTGHPTLVVNAAWRPDQRSIVSCDEGAEIRIWCPLD